MEEAVAGDKLRLFLSQNGLLDLTIEKEKNLMKDVNVLGYLLDILTLYVQSNPRADLHQLLILYVVSGKSIYF
jgi:hypothetical protein